MNFALSMRVGSVFSFDLPETDLTGLDKAVAKGQEAHAANEHAAHAKDFDRVKELEGKASEAHEKADHAKGAAASKKANAAAHEIDVKLEKAKGEANKAEVKTPKEESAEDKKGPTQVHPQYSPASATPVAASSLLSSAPDVVHVEKAGSRVTVTALKPGVSDLTATNWMSSCVINVTVVLPTI